MKLKDIIILLWPVLYAAIKLEWPDFPGTEAWWNILLEVLFYIFGVGTTVLLAINRAKEKGLERLWRKPKKK